MNAIKTRKSNIELLRIISMLMIVAYHFAYYNNGQFEIQSFSFKKEITNIFLMCGKLGSNIFVIISGYFLINSKKINITKLIKLIFQMTFYSILIFIAFLLITDHFSITSFIKSCFPYIFNVWWFASTYLLIYLLHPFINNFINNLSQKNLLYLIILLIFLWSIIPTFTGSFMHSNELLWFFLLYLIASYISLYVNLDKLSKNKIFTTTIIVIVLTYLSSVVFDLIGLKYYIFAEKSTHFFSMQSITILTISICIFLSFLKIDLKSNNIINTISKCSFGVYLIHDHFLVRDFLWKNIFLATKLYIIDNYLINSILKIVIVFLCCTAIEFLRINLLNKFEDKLASFIKTKGGLLWQKMTHFTKKLLEH